MKKRIAHYCRNSRDINNHDTTKIPSSPEATKSTAEFYRAQPVLDQRIHILGVGNVGSFVAHALRGIPNPPPVTLIYHRKSMIKAWEDSAKTLSLVTDGDTEVRDGYDVELAIPRKRYHGKEVGTLGNVGEVENTFASREAELRIEEGESTEPIHSLIVCSKTPFVLQALSAVKHRLHKDSVVLFLQNGMGTVEEVDKEIFPNPQTRPYYMVGVNSHGLHASKQDRFKTVHAGFGTISLGLLPHEREREPAPYAPIQKFKAGRNGNPVEQKAVRSEASSESTTQSPTTTNSTWTSNQRYLLRTLLRSPVLSAASFSPPDLLQMQLEKLAVNCIINPLTVILDARNGSILYNYSFSRIMRLVLAEVSLVIRSLPELQYIPNVQQRFDPGRLETLVVSVAQKTKNNISSMLADTRAGQLTEVNYINGWIVKKGEEQGIKCLMNYMLLHIVEGKGRMIETELGEEVPLVQDIGSVQINFEENSGPTIDQTGKI